MAGAGGYYDYFGALAGPRGKGYYSLDLGAWHIVALNSHIAMGAGSEQERWLRADLAADDAKCTLAMFHAPRWSSGAAHGDNTGTGALVQALYDDRADVILSGHEHTYERFERQSPSGIRDDLRGITQIISGGGGRSTYGFGTVKRNSAVRLTAYGFVEMRLRPTSWELRMIDVDGRVRDSAIRGCSL